MSESLIDIQKWLYPVSWIYGAGVGLRNKLFDWGYLPEKNFRLPVICVGNLTVGGTGKTPHTEYLIRLLQRQGQVAVLSRGYKRQSKGFVLAGADTPARMIGDEPRQMKQKFPHIHMAVDADRRHGIEQLLRKSITPQTDFILLDDAYQHRYVKAGLNILLVNYRRMITDDALLPAGRLREAESGKYRAHIVIVTKCPNDLTPWDYRDITNRLELHAFQQLYLTTFRYGKLRPLFNGGKEYSLQSIQPAVHILLLTGIASPRQLEQELATVNRNVHPLTFNDHHHFNKEDMEEIGRRFDELPEGKRMIITTEKDAARLTEHPLLPETIKPYIYVIPIEVAFLQGQQESFNQNIMEYVRKNPRDSRVLEG